MHSTAGSVESLSSPGSPGTGRRSSSHLLLLVRFHVDFRVRSVECGMGRIFLLSFFFFKLFFCLCFGFYYFRGSEGFLFYS